jgi:hypothetical protein
LYRFFDGLFSVLGKNWRVCREEEALVLALSAQQAFY